MKACHRCARESGRTLPAGTAGLRPQTTAPRRRRRAIREWIEARTAAQAARREGARVSTATFKGQKAPPKRMPKNAVMFHDLPPEEQAQIAAEMAPLHAAEAVTKAAVDRLKNAEAVLAALVVSSPNGGSVNA